MVGVLNEKRTLYNMLRRVQIRLGDGVWNTTPISKDLYSEFLTTILQENHL